MSNLLLCTTTRRREPCQTLALDGAYLCQGHRGELERLVAEAPARENDLERALGPSGIKTSGRSDVGLSVDEDAAELRQELTAIIAGWCGVVAQTRGITPPAQRWLTYTAPWLIRHIDWCAAQTFAADMLAEIRQPMGRSIAHTDIRARRVDLGEPCLTHTDGERCEGLVTIVVRGDDWTARCPVCGIDQPATPYLRIAQRGTWLDVAGVIQLAGLFGVPCNEDVIYQWKRRRRIFGRLTPGGAVYDLGSVQRYLVRRQTEQPKISA